MSEPSLPEKILAIDRALAGAGIAHAFGGALALAYYAEPRATIDIDVNIFLAPAGYPAVEGALGTLGVQGGVDQGRVEREGQCRMDWGGTPIDLFFAYDALHEAMRGAIRREPFGEASIPVLAPEHLLVCKAVFDRPKDWLDIEQVVLCVEDLDTGEVLAWLDRILDPGDPRRGRFERLVGVGG
ncbi:MAG TPA: hypothetical protein VGX16_04455 [Solirubrobacteraceae bacterium]|nr:hypothetical protein [Solirubrobacteraceae bacterium]